jgi:hypothetical protein
MNNNEYELWDTIENWWFSSGTDLEIFPPFQNECRFSNKKKSKSK